VSPVHCLWLLGWFLENTACLFADSVSLMDELVKWVPGDGGCRRPAILACQCKTVTHLPNELLKKANGVEFESVLGGSLLLG